MLMQLLLFGQTAAPAADSAQLIGILAALGTAIGIWVVFSVMGSRNQQQTSERLEKFGRVGRGERTTASTGAEKLQDLLERTAPAFAKPLAPQTEEEQSQLRVYLSNGGWRSESAPSIYLGVRFAFLLLGLLIAATLVLPRYGFRDPYGWAYSFIVAALFFYLPAVVVWWMIRGRKEQIFFGLPDALDLMVVCVEAGLGLDAAMRKVCEEMGRTFPIISEEFSICNFQLQMGRPRREVLHDLGVRTGVDDMKSLAAILIQADRFGSSIATALRVQSDSMRVRRRQQAEERAAKTAVQLIFPLVLFIFPAIFIVLVGPAGIRVADTLLKMNG